MACGSDLPLPLFPVDLGLDDGVTLLLYCRVMLQMVQKALEMSVAEFIAVWQGRVGFFPAKSDFVSTILEAI